MPKRALPVRHGAARQDGFTGFADRLSGGI
jgi:hypothetical protein